VIEKFAGCKSVRKTVILEPAKAEILPLGVRVGKKTKTIVGLINHDDLSKTLDSQL
jgi:hypothetical protein